jgi:hypothetical protein
MRSLQFLHRTDNDFLRGARWCGFGGSILLDRLRTVILHASQICHILWVGGVLLHYLGQCFWIVFLTKHILILVFLLSK